MNGFNLGPDWFWKLLTVLASAGALAIFVGLIWLVIRLYGCF